MRTPKVSIVTISYNQEDFIRQALDSFLIQKVAFPYEIIIMDDASTDATPQIIAEYAVKYPQIKATFRKKNVGAVNNFYEALQAATGEYIALCEGDDYWTSPMKLTNQSAYLDNNPDAALCFHPVEVMDQDGKKPSYVFPKGIDMAEFTHLNLVNHNYIQTNSVMYRRQNYLQLPAGILPLDWYLHLYHAKFGTIGFLPEVMSVYRKHDGGLWHESDTNLDQIWKKHGVAHLALYLEIAKLYPEVEYKIIVDGHIQEMFNTLRQIDNQYDLQLLIQIAIRYPVQSAKYFEQALQTAIDSLLALQAHADEQAVIVQHQLREISQLNDRVKNLSRPLTVKAIARLKRVVKP